METNDKALLLFQLGPVQKFIAQAETVGDLRAGSEILSELTAAALRTIPDYTANVVFPAVDENTDLKGIPNRFLVFVPRENAEQVARNAAQAAKDALKAMAEEAWAKLKLDPAKKTAYNRQVAQFLQTTWAVLSEPSGDMGTDYKTIGTLMAMRRNTRAFDAWLEEGDGEVKDYLSGKEAALKGGRYSGRGAMNLIKLAREETGVNEKAKKDLGKYRAVIALDGDHMGEMLSGFKTREEHLDFSRKLAGFANWLNSTEQKIITSEKGFLIYAGGDDVLAVVKATAAIGIARELAAKFVEKVNEPAITASVGIAIGSTKVPLQDLVHAAHAAESHAKHVYGRDALALDIYKRSGEILKWGCKWNSAAFEIYDVLTEYENKKMDTLSRFAYKLAGFLEPYAITKATFNDDMRRVFIKETQHTLRQTEGIDKILKPELLERFIIEDSIKEHPEDFLGLFLCETFINRPRD